MIPSHIDTVLLDMNGTFMFGHDNFGPAQDYAATHARLGGSLPADFVNETITAVFDRLLPMYGHPQFVDTFPTVEEILAKVLPEDAVPAHERERLILTFAHHERGRISPENVEALRALASRYRLGLVSDIWAPKDAWLEEFERTGIADLFEATSFSSDIRMVKPSPLPFLNVLSRMNADRARTIYVGDSLKHDLAGANAAGIPCILVGGATDPSALGCCESLVALARKCSR